MKSAFECFQQAAKCEQMASTTKDDASRASLVATANHWRALGKAARTRERLAENYEQHDKSAQRPVQRSQ